MGFSNQEGEESKVRDKIIIKYIYRLLKEKRGKSVFKKSHDRMRKYSSGISNGVRKNSKEWSQEALLYLSDEKKIIREYLCTKDSRNIREVFL